MTLGPRARAIALVLPAALVAFGYWGHQDESSDGATTIRLILESHRRFVIDHWFLAFAVPTLIATLVVAARLAAPKRPRLALVGVCVGVLGLAGSSASIASEIMIERLA